MKGASVEAIASLAATAETGAPAQDAEPESGALDTPASYRLVALTSAPPSALPQTPG